MVNAREQARTIYEKICSTSGDRPYSGYSVDQMLRDINTWREGNLALAELKRASPEVQTAFLGHSVEWLKAESRDHSNFRVTATLLDAILHSLEAAPKPLPTDLVLKLLTELRENPITRYYFPFDQFLSILTRDQVTEEIRAELRRLHLQYAPSPTGKIDERTLQTRTRLAELMHIEGEKQLDPGRGPWSQAVFDEISAKDDIPRFGWQALLEHCRTLQQAVPGANWKKRAQELIRALGESEVFPTLERWLALGPTPGQMREARSPIEDSPYQKGVVWCLALSQRPELASSIGDFALACLRKIPMLGAVSQKVGFACVPALGSMESKEAIFQLARLRSKVKYSVAQRLIEKSLHQAAERSGLTVDDLEDFAVQAYSLDSQGKTEIVIGDAKSAVSLSAEGQVGVLWQTADGKIVKSAPAHIRKALGQEVKSVSRLAKELEQSYTVERQRLESSFINLRTMSLPHWRKYFMDHPLLGLLGRRLIWVFTNEQGSEHSGLYGDGQVCDSSAAIVDLSSTTKVRLWHPLSSEASEVDRWRSRIFAAAVRQPFRQAFREFYQVTDDERQTRTYSNRFAGIIMRQHQFLSLCRARGWNYRLMGAGFDGFNVPTKLIAPWNMHVEFYVDLAADREPSLSDSGLAEQSGSGINLFVGSDQIRFYRDRREIAMDEVPAIVYSEIMRDIDLFTSVCAVGPDESWSDQGDRGTGFLDSRRGFQDLSAILALRVDMLSRVLPLTAMKDQCKIEKGWLVVQGKLGTYRIQISWGGILRQMDSGVRQLKIPRKLLEEVPLDLSQFPIELDHRTEMVLRTAHVLANDWEIDSPELIQQLM